MMESAMDDSRQSVEAGGDHLRFFLGWSGYGVVPVLSHEVSYGEAETQPSFLAALFDRQERLVELWQIRSDAEVRAESDAALPQVPAEPGTHFFIGRESGSVVEWRPAESLETMAFPYYLRVEVGQGGTVLRARLVHRTVVKGLRFSYGDSGPEKVRLEKSTWFRTVMEDMPNLYPNVTEARAVELKEILMADLREIGAV